ncbi:YchJ family protein [Corallincola platygyrae]|uniref:UPF0225 protein ACFSJ3_05930 n=1 Tax=Corallincola platygyrae TaxID=1193278 RepID=A0ABW4XL46_9GAMM
MQNPLCPCGSQQSYQQCCEPYHLGEQHPQTCEQLMRSRYSAFAMAKGQYLFDTYHPDFRGDDQPEDFAESARRSKWLKLEVEAAQGGVLDESGWVKFAAWFYEGKRVMVHREHSRFAKLAGHWVYTDGDFKQPDTLNIGRNDSCPCGSGKKFKRCCGS